jgi:uncharacterized protein
MIQRHNGARTQFGYYFVKPGKIDKRFGILFTKLFDLRQKGDYGDLFDFDKKVFEPLIEQVKKFIEGIKKQINQNNHISQLLVYTKIFTDS